MGGRKVMVQVCRKYLHFVTRADTFQPINIIFSHLQKVRNAPLARATSTREGRGGEGRGEKAVRLTNSTPG